MNIYTYINAKQRLQENIKILLVISTAGELVTLIYKYNFILYFFQSRLKLTCILQYAHTRIGFKWKQKKGKELITK